MVTIGSTKASTDLIYKRDISQQLSVTSTTPAATLAVHASSMSSQSAQLSADMLFTVIHSKMSSSPDSFQSQYDERFFPVRKGFTSNALATAVSDPGAVSSSAGKTLAEVASDARTVMDRNYKEMLQSGKAFNAASSEGRDWGSLMGTLDRRSLYAVASSEGHLFTKEESATARNFMDQQFALAMGMYSGPISERGHFSETFSSDPAEGFAAGQAFLSKVSSDEKSSGQWQLDFAGALINERGTRQSSQTHIHQEALPNAIAARAETAKTKEPGRNDIHPAMQQNSYLTAQFDYATGEYSYFINI